jgi:hypothetical protein
MRHVAFLWLIRNVGETAHLYTEMQKKKMLKAGRCDHLRVAKATLALQTASSWEMELALCVSF